MRMWIQKVFYTNIESFDSFKSTGWGLRYNFDVKLVHKEKKVCERLAKIT